MAETSAPNIYAIGDVTNRLNLTPVAIAEGHALAERLFGPAPRDWALEAVATAVFSSPPIATVGLTEAEAAALGPADIYLTRFTPMRHTLTGRRAPDDDEAGGVPANPARAGRPHAGRGRPGNHAGPVHRDQLPAPPSRISTARWASTRPRRRNSSPCAPARGWRWPRRFEEVDAEGTPPEAMGAAEMGVGGSGDGSGDVAVHAPG